MGNPLAATISTEQLVLQVTLQGKKLHCSLLGDLDTKPRAGAHQDSAVAAVVHPQVVF